MAKKRLELNCPECGKGPMNGPNALNEYSCSNENNNECTWYSGTYDHGKWKNIKRTGISLVRAQKSSHRPYSGTTIRLHARKAVKLRVLGPVAVHTKTPWWIEENE